MASKKKKKTSQKVWKLPKSVRVGPHELTVIETGAAMAEYGHFDYDDLAIRIRNNVSIGVQYETFWHEVVEGLNAVYELKLPHRTIQVIGASIYQALASIKY